MSGVPQRSVLVGLSPEEGQERDKSAGAPSIKKQAEKVGTVPPGEEKVVWKPHSNLPISEGGLQRCQRGTLHQEL